MRTVPPRRGELPAASSLRIISVFSEEFSVAAYLRMAGTGGVASGAWFSANDPIAFPFALNAPAQVKRLGWANGNSALSTSVDIGIYDLAYNRLVSGGGTARSGVTSIQWVDVTDTDLKAGRYYLASSSDATTAGQVRHYGMGGNAALLLAGVQDSATDAYPLPNPLTNMAAAATITVVPSMFIAMETV